MKTLGTGELIAEFSFAFLLFSSPLFDYFSHKLGIPFMEPLNRDQSSFEFLFSGHINRMAQTLHVTLISL